MLVKRGSVYLADFNPSKDTEPGKIRPCPVMRSDLLNEARHPGTTELPHARYSRGAVGDLWETHITEYDRLSLE